MTMHYFEGFLGVWICANSAIKISKLYRRCLLIENSLICHVIEPYDMIRGLVNFHYVDSEADTKKMRG